VICSRCSKCALVIDPNLDFFAKLKVQPVQPRDAGMLSS
jgi:hypothetical protein